jgi:hypothetical protein
VRTLRRSAISQSEPPGCAGHLRSGRSVELDVRLHLKLSARFRCDHRLIAARLRHQDGAARRERSVVLLSTTRSRQAGTTTRHRVGSSKRVSRRTEMGTRFRFDHQHKAARPQQQPQNPAATTTTPEPGGDDNPRARCDNNSESPGQPQRPGALQRQQRRVARPRATTQTRPGRDNNSACRTSPPKRRQLTDAEPRLSAGLNDAGTGVARINHRTVRLQERSDLVVRSLRTPDVLMRIDAVAWGSVRHRGNRCTAVEQHHG